MSFRLLLLTLAAAASASAGCTGAADSGTGDSDLGASTPETSAAAGQVARAFAKMKEQREGALLGKYYEDGVRVQACWLNPAAAKLSDLKKAYYCSLPLEFRLCNTVVVLATRDADVDRRTSGFLDCQRRVDAAFGGQGFFIYDEAFNTTYGDLFLRDASGLATDEERAFVAAHKPAFTQPFVELLARDLASLAKEAIEHQSQELDALIKDAAPSL